MLPWEMAGGLWDSENPPYLTMRHRTGTLPVSRVRAAADASLAGLSAPKRRAATAVWLLWHDHWSEAHEIAQAHEGADDFDLLHAIGHRREGDYGNSIYWFHQAGRHGIFSDLEADARMLLERKGVLRKHILPAGKWNPEGFVKAVKAHADHPVLRALQALEMTAFFTDLVSRTKGTF